MGKFNNNKDFDTSLTLVNLTLVNLLIMCNHQEATASMDVDVKIVDGAAAVATGEVTAATLGGTLGWDSALFI